MSKISVVAVEQPTLEDLHDADRSMLENLKNNPKDSESMMRTFLGFVQHQKQNGCYRHDEISNLVTAMACGFMLAVVVQMKKQDETVQ